LTDVDSSGYTISWELDNPIAGAQVYWMRQLTSAPFAYSPPQIAEGASQECVGSAAQTSTGSTTVSCPSAVGTGYTIWLLIAVDTEASNGPVYLMQYALSETSPSQPVETTTTVVETTQSVGKQFLIYFTIPFFVFHNVEP